MVVAVVVTLGLRCCSPIRPDRSAADDESVPSIEAVGHYRVGSCFVLYSLRARLRK